MNVHDLLNIRHKAIKISNLSVNLLWVYLIKLVRKMHTAFTQDSIKKLWILDESVWILDSNCIKQILLFSNCFDSGRDIQVNLDYSNNHLGMLVWS